MSWITVIWSMNAAVCLTLAGIYLLVWLKARTAWGYLLFSFGAIAAAAVAACESLLMRADTVEQYGTLMRWSHVFLWLLFVSIVGFTRFHLRAGRPWLAWAVVGTRTLVLAINFHATPNINFKVISGLRHVPFLGESISMPAGTLHPWGIVAKLSSVLLLGFLVNASIEVWRRGEGRWALFLGGSMIFFTTAAVHSALVERGAIQSPYLISFAFLATILAMAYELSGEVLRAAQLVRELHASEAGLRESEERMTLAAEAANVGVWLHDLVRHEIWASDTWRALFGFTKSERIDFSGFLQRLHPEDREAVNQTLTNALAGDGTYEVECRLVLPGGGMRWIASRGRVEFSDDRKPSHLRGASVDITARKQAELEVQQQRVELAHFSRVSMLGELSASLAHELNQPLGAILRNAEAAELFLQDPSPDLEELRTILADIRKDDQRAGAVIDRMRSLLKRREVAHRPLDLNVLAGEVISLVRPDADARKVRVALEPAASLPLVRGDRVQLQQVLLNLLLNAMDAVNGSAPDRRRVTVRVHAVGARIEVAVSDNGHGIPTDKLARVFEPFFTTKPNGMGMGLPISRTIMEAHLGSIRAENDPAGGATFCFALPVPKERSTA
jgi:two-component system, LuxR family, sensor kinase FixL